MGKKGGSKVQVVDYYMSLFYGMCHGADAMLSLIVGEKEAWSGNVGKQTVFNVNRTDLFGGNKKEGGVSGNVYFLPGNDTQVMPPELAVKFGLTSATCPGFRGIASVFFTGATASRFNYFGNRGFLWGSNNPYLRSIWMRLRRSPKALAANHRMIPASGATVSRVGNLATVNGMTVTLTEGSVQLVNGVTLLLSAGVLSVNSIPIEVSTTHNTITVNSVEYTGMVATTPLMTIIATADTTFSVHLSSSLDANPAAMIYECLTDTDWGMGASPSIINLQSFEDAAETLLNERFGMSMMWTKQSTIETFVSEIIDHIQATLFVNPRDGLLTLKLIRDDYDPATLPVLDADNCEITSFDRKAWGETINEIVVTWTNPENEQEETVSAQDLANITIQGSVISDSRNYYGVRNADLAMRLAKRDLATASAPLATFELDVDRSAWDFVPGGVAILNYPEYGISGLILRLGKIDYGKPGQMTIKLTAIEDIFSLPVAAYTVPDGTMWQDPSMDPVPLVPSRVITTPAFFLSSLSDANLSNSTYPDVYPAVLAADSSGSDIVSYELVEQVVQPSGDTAGAVVATKPVLGYSTLPADLMAEPTSLVETFGLVSNGVGPFVSGFVFIGDADEHYQEIAMIKAVDDTGWTLVRGALDTVPRSWPAGTPVWFAAKTTNFVDTSSLRGATEIVRCKLLPRTSKGLLAEADAPIIGIALSGRPWLPNRPANVKVNDTAFGQLNLSATPPASLTVTWANRNRTMEDTIVVPWTDATVAPETGQTTTVAVYATDGTLITAHNGLTGTSFNLPMSSFGGLAVADVKVTSKRDGLESLQGHSIRIRMRPDGWGDKWGEDWGSTVSGTSIPPFDITPTGPAVDPSPSDPWYPIP